MILAGGSVMIIGTILQGSATTLAQLLVGECPSIFLVRSVPFPRWIFRFPALEEISCRTHPDV
jgi:hypothetical protein